MNSDTYRQIIHKSRYSRWDDKTGQRETYQQTVERYLSFMTETVRDNNGFDLTSYIPELREHMENMDALPSMRALMTAGKALALENVAAYNCAAVNIDSPVVFAEVLYVLMNGTGVGYSVEYENILKLPEIPHKIHKSDTVIKVRDSKMGWAIALKELTAMLYAGQEPAWDLSAVRPKGSRLKTFGGRSSGPEPLDNCFKFFVKTFHQAVGRKLRPIECHDLCCKVGEIVVVGGVRRAALIALFSKADREMLMAKNGPWWEKDGQRALANNSIVIEEQPSAGEFLGLWQAIVDSRSGEPGLQNIYATIKHMEKKTPGRLEKDVPRLLNPCAEISLRSGQFCNLSTWIARPDDSVDDLMKKVEIAAIFGTMQATLTNFKFLRKVWQRTTEAENLLGVTPTGVQDHPLLNMQAMRDRPDETEKLLQKLEQHAVAVNVEWSKKLGIEPSASVTAIKPAGNTGALVGSSSGIHAAYGEYYIRRVRQSTDDPLTTFLVDQGVPHELAEREHNTMIFSFPMKAASTAVTEDSFSAVEAIDYYLLWQRHYTTHKPSCTIHIKDDEWMEVGAKVFKHFDEIMGISFLPKDDNVYVQAPFELCDKADHDNLLRMMPKNIDWSKLREYEKEDNTTSSQELACTSGACEL